MYGFVYITTNTANGKMYVGKRVSATPDSDEQYLGSGKLLRRAIIKYGREKFTRRIVGYANNHVDLSRLEIDTIRAMNAVLSQSYYNLAEGGSGGNTWAYMSVEARSELSRRIQRSLTPTQKLMQAERFRLRWKGVPKTASHREALRLAKTGKPRGWRTISRDDYALRRTIEVARGINVPPKVDWTSRHHTKVAKAKMSAVLRDAHREALAAQSRWYAEAAIEQRRVAQIAYWNDPANIADRNDSDGYRAQMQRRRDEGDARYRDLPEMLKTMSQSEAAVILGVDQSAVAQRVRDHGIAVEHTEEYGEKIQAKRESAAKLAQAARRAQGDKTFEGYDILKMAETMTQAQIGRIVGVSQVRVSQRLRQLRRG